MDHECGGICGLYVVGEGTLNDRTNNLLVYQPS